MKKKIKKFFRNETVQKLLLVWGIFAIFTTLYVIFFIPVIKKIESEFIIGIIGVGAGIVMMVISEVIVELFGYSELVKYKNKRMLKKIRKDRPNQTIHKVLYYYYDSDYGFYNVEVDMEGQFFETKVTHTRRLLPYPLDEYQKLTPSEKENWSNDKLLNVD